MFSTFGQSLLTFHQRQPLLIGGAFFILGICCGYLTTSSLDGSGLLVGFCLCGVVALLRRRSWKNEGLKVCDLVLISLAFFILGTGRAAWDQAGRAQEATWLMADDGKVTCSVSCRVGPDVKETPFRGHSVRYSFQASDPLMHTVKGDIRLRYLPLTVNWYASDEDKAVAPKPGETWRFRGRVTLAQSRRSQLAVLTMNTGKNEKRSFHLENYQEGGWPLRLASMRREAINRLGLGLEGWGPIPGLNQAMLLGYNSEMPKAMRKIFSDSGTIHVFAVSGTHIAFVAGLLVLLVGMTGINRIYWIFIIGPLLVGYTCITGSCPSAIRACLMAFFYFLAPLAGRKPTLMSALVATAVIVHAWCPDYVFNIGSVLSFTVVLGLIAFMGPFCLFFQTLFGCERLRGQEELLLAAGCVQKAAWVRRIRIGLRFLADLIAISLAAWLASVPLTGYYFGRFTPGGLLANLIITPCSGLIVIAATLGLVTSYISEWVAITFNHAASFLTSIMVKTAEVTAACPGLGVDTGKWAVWQVFVWLIGLVLLGSWIYWRGQPKDGLAWLKTDEAIK
jgi:ComEC/Rec2-related protein